MNKTCAIVLFAVLAVTARAGFEQCFQKCYQDSGCSDSRQCHSQMQVCDEFCSHYQHPFHEYLCLRDCADQQFGLTATAAANLDSKFKQFLQCEQECLSNEKTAPAKSTTSTTAQGATTSTSAKQTAVSPALQKLKKQIEQDPFSHPGTTLLALDCQKDAKKKVFILKGNTHKMILNYFDSRCDAVQLPASKRNSDDFFFKWTDYHHQQNWDAFKPGKQIVNHLPNLRSLISDKDGIVKTLKEFDQKRLYNFDSSSFHFETYLFDLNKTTYNEQEQHFIDNVKGGYWLSKDPDGSLGQGIYLFRGTDEIKDHIKRIKAVTDNSVKTRRDIVTYSVIQRYLDNTLLWDGHKFDMRAYVLIASVDPFVVLYQPGFIRKCVGTYDLDFQKFDMNEAFKHITNRIHQSKHPRYEELKESLLITPPEFERFLRTQVGLTDAQMRDFELRTMKTVAYTMAAARDKFKKEKGMFQLLGVDIIWDDKLNPWLIEFNTSAGLYNLLRGHLYVVPQLVQSTLDLVTTTHADMDFLWDAWKHPESLDLARWKILYNEATGQDILKEDQRV